ncbi:hypothetical protein ABZS61_21310 [Streptomyces sp. NPDC005566]|uniref:hypothetical protein n=1 Tax=Streptomyces sp. NPDC005566 TaxID=3156886 RepID=UPI0033B78BC7
MTTQTNSPLKSLPNPPRPRRSGPGNSGGEAPKVVAEGVRVAVLPDPRAVTVTSIQPGLVVRGLGREEIPVADWLCACGHHERARGRSAVIELTTRVRVQQCPHTTPAASGRAA